VWLVLAAVLTAAAVAGAADAAGVAAAGVAGEQPTASPTAAATLPATAPASAAAPLFAGMDLAIAPGEDFFAYANGGWVNSVEIPADHSYYGTGTLLTEVTDERLGDLVRRAAASRIPLPPDSRKIADYYLSFMDEARIEARGLKPLHPTLARIAAISDRSALASYLGSTLRADVDILNSTKLYTENLFGLWVAQDLDDPTRYSPFLLQGGLGMPDRDYYLSDSPRMADIRSHYQSHIAAMLRLAQVSDADAKATAVYALERRIAQTHASRADSEQVTLGDNHWSREQLASRAPGLDWEAYLRAAGLQRQAQFVVWQPAALSGMAALCSSEPLDTWRAYLQFHAINHMAAFLARSVVDEQFSFYGKVLQGTPQQRDRWKRALQYTSAALGEAVGRLYVERYFPAADKQRIERMVANLLAAYAKRIDGLEWMDSQTRLEAKAKLAALKVGIGYPDHWRDYSALRVERSDAFGNAQRAELFELRRNLAKLGRPVDRSEWVMTPQLVNAVNLPAMNALNFPAAILQPPYFDPSQPAAMSYGAIGAIIGHEISHSFDDQGALFDAQGRLHNWWTEADFAHFQASAAQLVKQFDAYRPLPDLAVNGRQTLGENIADLAGLAAAYSAYRLSQDGQPGPVVSGYDDTQQFFLSFARSWRAKIREPALRQQIITDGHAPAEYRADAPRNLDAWYEAFDVKPGQSLYLAPTERVRMW
jgi:predicted metalloendopeptidase